MPTIFTHAVAGATVARIAAPSSHRKTLVYAAAIAAMLPDADVIAYFWGVPYESVLGHRGLMHSLAFAFALGVAGAVRWRRVRIAACLAVATASHGVLDAFTNGGRGVAFLAPFSNERFFFPVTPIAVSPLGLRFFSERGMYVLASEIVWVWVPLLILNAAAGMVRARRAHPS